MLNIPLRYTIKNTIVKGPIGYLLRKSGAVPIVRTREQSGRASYIDLMTGIIEKTDRIAMVITPEGTRSINNTWKTGFYHVAKNSNVPIALGYLDYKRKVSGIGLIIYPNNFDEDMKEIMCFYENVTPRHPERFSIDKKYTCADKLKR